MLPFHNPWSSEIPCLQPEEPGIYRCRNNDGPKSCLEGLHMQAQLKLGMHTRDLLDSYPALCVGRVRLGLGKTSCYNLMKRYPGF
jgi:hypothetical protein